MKRYAALALLAVFASCFPSAAEDVKTKDPTQLFYNANQAYGKRDYVEAVEDYVAILDMGLENGNLYYNIGNGFLRLGKAGYAILCYEKAKRLMPQDSDLKSNMAYAVSLAEGALAPSPEENVILKGVKNLFSDLSLRMIALSSLILYMTVMLMAAFFIFSPSARRFKFIFILTVAVFAVSLAGFGVRFYDEEVLSHGIVVQKDVECKYEPIDKSTTYYKLQEGAGVLVLKTRDGWRQVRRPDGKVGWVKKEAVEEI